MLKNFFGFIKAEIICPLNMKRPVLPLKHQGKTIYPVGYWFGDALIQTKFDMHKPYLQARSDNHLTKDHGLVGKRTISPIGSFNMTINSCEYYNALTDYYITINSGFLFEANDIFSEFVDKMYELRQKYDKNEAMNYIAKLLMNATYSRFAMKPITAITSYINRDEDIFNFIDKNEIHEYSEINRNKIMITYSPINKDKEILFQDFKNCIAIASAITAYSRVFMSKYKILGLLYTDTDSAFLIDH
jgi:hypothetical protein